jgi:acyl-CoA hydrolase
MDEEGYFSLSGAAGALTGPVAVAKKIVLEVNEALPRIPGGPETKIHISRADAITEVGCRPLWEMAPPPPTETDSRIAAQLIPHITDGTTLQLGIGGMPNALGELLADSDVHDLGMHTELCSDGYLALEKAGKLTNLCKKTDPGIGVMGLAIGTKELYDWISENPGLRVEPLRIVNSPAVIAGLDRVVSINSCLNVDLYGQVASESVGTRQISGTGGQLDFVTGASNAEHGASFLCMSSSFTDRNGTRHSRILPSLSGDIVTTPRSQAYWIVTEYGAVNLAGRTTWERADALISIAHPDFREELIRAAERQHIWLASNRR